MEVIQVQTMDYTYSADKAGKIYTDGSVYTYFDNNGAQWTVCKEIADYVKTDEVLSPTLEETTRDPLQSDELVKLKSKFTVDEIVLLRKEGLI